MKYLVLCGALLFSTALAAQQKIDKDYVGQQIMQGNQYTLLLLHPTGYIPPADSMDNWRMQHLINLFQMHADKKTSVFGPVTDPKSDLTGIIVFNSSDTVKIKSWIDADPFVKNKVLSYKLYPWFGIPDQKLLPSEKPGQK